MPIATPIAKGSIVKGGGKVGHVGGSNVDIALSTFRKTVPSTVIYEVSSPWRVRWMCPVEMYARVRRACLAEGMNGRENSRVFGLHRDTVVEYREVV